MAAFDRTDRTYYDKFTDEEKKRFSTYLMLRYGASVDGPPPLQAYYLMALNEQVNKHFFELNKHTKLQWLMCTTVSPGTGTKRHYWLAAKKKEGTSLSKHNAALCNLFPNKKQDDIDVLLKINSPKELTEHFKDAGLELKI